MTDFEQYPDLGFGVNYPKFEHSKAEIPQDKLLLLLLPLSVALCCLLSPKAN